MVCDTVPVRGRVWVWKGPPPPPGVTRVYQTHLPDSDRHTHSSRGPLVSPGVPTSTFRDV